MITTVSLCLHQQLKQNVSEMTVSLKGYTHTRRLPLIRDRVMGAADSAETPRRPYPQTPPPAPPGGVQGVPDRHSPSSVSWAVPWASSQWDVPGTPPKEGVQEASGIDARATSTGFS
ncbi:hypothetical protein XENOCAPTIV_010545 [Xenoophorus captivus]|uniref:Uncharacterized protein n=1 Tax=Xenoophorus captivus TaxID=1517983 RepID=A0ABV0RVI0_9TELE